MGGEADDATAKATAAEDAFKADMGEAEDVAIAAVQSQGEESKFGSLENIAAAAAAASREQLRLAQNEAATVASTWAQKVNQAADNEKTKKSEVTALEQQLA